MFHACSWWCMTLQVLVTLRIVWWLAKPRLTSAVQGTAKGKQANG